MESDSNSPKPVRHRQVTSFSKRPTLSSPPISKNNSVANSDPTCKRRVTFPDDDSLLNASIHSGDEIWRVDPNTTNDIIIDAYTAACLHVRRQPLSVVIEQISKSAVPWAKTRIPALLFKGVQLSERDIEALEQVFKYCQAYHMSFENTNLNDTSIVSLLDSLDYFAPCRELCLARNPRLTGLGIKYISSFISKYPFLNWLDLRGIPLIYADAQALGFGLRGQYNIARSIVAKYNFRVNGKGRKGDAAVSPEDEKDEASTPDPDTMRDAKEYPATFQLQMQLYLPKSPTAEESRSVAASLQHLPPICLRGLHLGQTSISGAALAEVAAAARIAGHLRDLRLPGNRLGPADMEALVPMIRYYPGLHVLDLSCNELGDDGLKHLCTAISRPSYPTPNVPNNGIQLPSLSSLYCCLRRLYLCSVGLTPTGAKHLALCLPSLGHLTHLDLSENPELGCQGVVVLRTALQASTRKRLVYLGLAYSGIACQGAIALAEVLADTPRALRRLDLSGNHIAEAGLMAISKSLIFATQLVQLIGLEDNRPPESETETPSGPPPPKSPALGALTTKLSAFRLSRKSLSGEDTPSPPSTGHLRHHRRRRSSGSSSLAAPPPPTPLWLDLLRGIHAQLATNLDARLALSNATTSPSSNVHKNDNGAGRSRRRRSRTSEIRLFRGYARFSTIGEQDPRRLPGDTSDSDLEDSNPYCINPVPNPPAANDADVLRTDSQSSSPTSPSAPSSTHSSPPSPATPLTLPAAPTASFGSSSTSSSSSIPS